MTDLTLRPLRPLRIEPGFAAFDKPSGMAVHRGWCDDDAPLALEAAREHLGVPVFPVHRLDRATSGVLIFALSSEDARDLQASFQAGRVTKHYLALVRGRPPAEGTIDHPVPRSKELVGPEHRVPAVTDFRTLGTAEVAALGRSFSLVLCRPRTGRQHQIRRHMKHLSHPLVGDANYGKGDLNRYFRDAFDLPRLALHACLLEFPDPRTGERVTLHTPLPPDFAGALEKLGLSGVYRGPEPGESTCPEPTAPSIP